VKVGYLHFVGVSVLPDEADAITVVDPNVLPGSVVLQCLQRIAWRTKILKTPGRVKLEQLSNCALFDSLELPRPDSQEDLLSDGISKGLDQRIYRRSIGDKQSRDRQTKGY
jgi:hypothetical protein